jgi:hypothetical protein
MRGFFPFDKLRVRMTTFLHLLKMTTFFNLYSE